MLTVHIIPALSDNYIYLIHDEKNFKNIVIDPSTAAAVTDFLEKRNWTLNEIWNTHHHWDHTGGNLELKAKYGCKIFGPDKGNSSIPGIDTILTEQDILKLGKCSVQVIETPGHTAKALSFFVEQEKWLFCGDTLFSLGCGRLFEGTAQELWHSLEKLMRLPQETKVYAAHEYTEANIRFALSVDPENEALIKYQAKVLDLRKKNIPSLPSQLSLELNCNPFLRCNDPFIKEKTNTKNQESWQTFRVLREIKDHFK